jgi:hypothetical protein
VCHSRNKRINWVISAAERSELDPGNSYAAAVYGADAADRVDLYNGADIIGDINLGDGEKTLTHRSTHTSSPSIRRRMWTGRQLLAWHRVAKPAMPRRKLP